MRHKKIKHPTLAFNYLRVSLHDFGRGNLNNDLWKTLAYGK